MLTRRKFIGTTLGAGAALATGVQSALPQGTKKRMIVDAQVHLWKANSPDFPWDPGVKPQLPEPFTIERALKLMDEAGVDRAVVVPPGLNDVNTYALEAAKRYPNRFAVMGRIPLQDPKSAARLPKWREQPGMLGVRVTFNNPTHIGWLSDGTANWFWPEAEKAGLPVMFLAFGRVNMFEPIAKRHPGLPLGGWANPAGDPARGRALAGGHPYVLAVGTIEPRKAWSYNPGQRRTRRAPDISYDNPGFNTDSMSTADSFTGFNGALDRYDWSYKGKSVKIVAYNAYDMVNAKVDQLIKPKHLNQDLVRYEPHRVHIVEAKLKAGTRHVYARRVMYMDEDAKTISAAENYDGRGQLWRVQELPMASAYHVPHCGTAAMEVVYDVLSGRYLALSMRAEEPPVNFFADELNEARYTPEAIRSLGVR